MKAEESPFREMIYDNLLCASLFALKMEENGRQEPKNVGCLQK